MLVSAIETEVEDWIASRSDGAIGAVQDGHYAAAGNRPKGISVPKFIKSAKDLVTPRQATVEGFLRQAMEKTRRAEPLVAAAIQFWQGLQKVPDINVGAGLKSIRPQLLAAAGFSRKSLNHLSDSEQQAALDAVLKVIHATSASDWRMDVFCRYLLTLGDALGGTMRNITGATGGARFTDAVLAALGAMVIAPTVTKASNGKVQMIAWRNRLLVLDRTPKFIGKNIDAIHLDTSHARTVQERLEEGKDYLACGELKGGIDPAGADEHWKTASSALIRIRDACANVDPKLFFVGAAIETSMAEEIFAQLQDGRLAHAANLTVPEQLQDLAEWLVSL